MQILATRPPIVAKDRPFLPQILPPSLPSLITGFRLKSPPFHAPSLKNQSFAYKTESALHLLLDVRPSGPKSLHCESPWLLIVSSRNQLAIRSMFRYLLQHWWLNQLFAAIAEIEVGRLSVFRSQDYF